MSVGRRCCTANSVEEVVIGPKKYRKKPVVIEAICWEDHWRGEVESFCPIVIWESHERILIPTLEGTMECRPGDYIIKGVAGEFYPCKPEIFEATYEEV